MNLTGIILCDSRVPPVLYESQPRILNASLCPILPIYPTIPVGGVCIPVNFTNHSSFENFQFNADSEFSLSLYQIIICGSMASVLSLLVIGAVRFVPAGFSTFIFGYTISAYSLFMMFLSIRLWIHAMKSSFSNLSFVIILFVCLFIWVFIVCLNHS
ncbi:unnamed protein product [Heterobilharzia americana]|nr:unnamed protein product [Heterobilharzia americana]